MNWMFTTLTLLMSLASTPGDLPITPAQIVGFDAAAGRVTIIGKTSGARTGANLAVVAGLEPVGWFEFVERVDDAAIFAGPPCSLPAGAGVLRGWLIAPETVGALRDRWPAEAPLAATIDEIGVGARGAWIAAGSDQGIRPDDHWWLRVGGQPAARFDVRHVEPSLCYCAVVPLAANVQLNHGRRVELWPGPGERRRGATRTAVGFVERRGDAFIAWLAAPPHASCPAEPHVDFFHNGRYVGHGVVEATDALFWYARLVAPDMPPAAPQPTTSAPTTSAPATSQPTTSAPTTTAPTPPLAVGDVAVVRTLADIAENRYVARVFSASREGALINAGEADGLTPGQTVPLWRDGMPAGTVEVVRVQRGYSIVQRPAAEELSPPEVGDIVRVQPPPPPPHTVGHIERLCAGPLFVARLATSGPAPLLAPLMLRQSAGTGGLVILLAADNRHACGFTLSCSLSEPPTAGQMLLMPPEETPPTPPR
ncbi:MAG: hypothetical protein PVJ57_15195 [Phycisphaerae bacterium]|jgi:hypothetical protein